jgi:hypothetical protein
VLSQLLFKVRHQAELFTRGDESKTPAVRADADDTIAYLDVVVDRDSDVSYEDVYVDMKSKKVKGKYYNREPLLVNKA